MDRRAWWAAVHGVTKNETRLRERACPYFIENFSSVFIRDIRLLLSCVFVCLLTSQDKLGDVPSSSVFWKSLGGVGITNISCLNTG